MRALLVVGVVALFAGCIATPTSSTTTSTTNGTSNESAPGQPGQAGQPSKAGVTPIHVAHDYSTPDETKTFAIAPNMAPAHIRIHFEGPANDGVCSGQGRIVVLRPDGSTYAEGNMPTTSVQGAGSPCSQLIDKKGVSL